MSLVYGWVRNILFFLILLSLLEIFLPSKKYEKFLRFFAGIVLILVVFQPFLKGFRIDEEILRQFGSFEFQVQARDLSREILGMENERLERMFASYEEAAVQDVEAMARDAGLSPVSARVRIERDEGSDDYGRVAAISMIVRPIDGGGRGSAEDSGNHTDITTIHIEIEEIDLENNEQSDPIVSDSQSNLQGILSDADTMSPELSELRRKVEQYYELQSENVEIRLEKQ